MLSCLFTFTLGFLQYQLFFFLQLLSGRIDPIIIVKLAKSAYWVNVNGSRPNNIIKIAKKFENRRFSAKSDIAQPFRKRGNFLSRILAMLFPHFIGSVISLILLGQWFQVIKNSLSWLLMSKDGTN